SVALDTIGLDAGAGVERHAQVVVTRNAGPDDEHEDALAFPGRLSSLVIEPRVTFVRTRWGVSDPRRNGARTGFRGWQRGSLTPPARCPPSSARRPRRHRAPPHFR